MKEMTPDLAELWRKLDEAVKVVNEWESRKGKNPLISIVSCEVCRKPFPVSTQDRALGIKRDYYWTCGDHECAKKKAAYQAELMRTVRKMVKETSKKAEAGSVLPVMPSQSL